MILVRFAVKKINYVDPESNVLCIFIQTPRISLSLSPLLMFSSHLFTLSHTQKNDLNICYWSDNKGNQAFSAWI